MKRSGKAHQLKIEQLQAFRKALGSGPVMILTHSNPDPDALASGAGLAYLIGEIWGIKVQLAYSGLVGRSENKAMMELLTPGWQHLDTIVDLYTYACYVLVDTQPGTGNNILPNHISPCAVIDHHPVRTNLDCIPFVDIRTNCGATSSIVYLYLEMAGCTLDANLATALFYGIQTDTQSLSRSGSSVDRDVYFMLLGLIDQDRLARVLQAGVPREYYQSFYDGLRSSRVYKSAVVSFLGSIDRPDFPAELADFLIRLEGIQAVLCLGHHAGVLFISLRTKADGVDAGMLVQKIVEPLGTAGGHGNYAGGQITLDGKKAEDLAEIVRQKFLVFLGEPDKGEDLLSSQ